MIRGILFLLTAGFVLQLSNHCPIYASGYPYTHPDRCVSMIISDQTDDKATIFFWWQNDEGDLSLFAEFVPHGESIFISRRNTLVQGENQDDVFFKTPRSISLPSTLHTPWVVKIPTDDRDINFNKTILFIYKGYRRDRISIPGKSENFPECVDPFFNNAGSSSGGGCFIGNIYNQ